MPKFTMKIENKDLLKVRAQLGGPFSHEKHFEEVDNILKYI